MTTPHCLAPKDEVVIFKEVIIYFPSYYLLYDYLKYNKYFSRKFYLRTDKII